MKGLLIKDFKLMKMQKNFFLMMIAIVIAISFFQNEISFPLGFLPFVISLFSLSTTSLTMEMHFYSAFQSAEKIM